MISTRSCIIVYSMIILQTGCSRLPTIETGRDETIRLATPASRRNFIPGAGYLLVTGEELLFEPAQGLTPIRKVRLTWKDITYIEKKNTLLGFPWIVKIGTKEGENYRFAVTDREMLLQAIEQVQGNKH